MPSDLERRTRPPEPTDVLPKVVHVEAKRIGTTQRAWGPLLWAAWHMMPQTMEREAQVFARRHDTVLRPATRYWWGVRASRRVHVMPHAEPQVLVAEDCVRGDATYERLQRLEQRALRALFLEQHRLQAWRVRDEDGQPEPAGLLWTVRLEMEGYPVPREARTLEDREAFTRAVQSLGKPEPVFSWALPREVDPWRMG